MAIVKSLTHAFFAILLLISFNARSQINTDLNWPREIEKNNYLITLYQPQLENLEGNDLSGRMALSVKNRSNKDISFGALWFKVNLETDRSTRIAVLRDLNITKIKFPDIENENNLNRLNAVITENIKSAEISVSIDHIVANLESVQEENALVDELKNTPPDIYLRKSPTVLVFIDGDPKMKTVENSSLEYVVNTPFFIVKDRGNYYLKGENHWYRNDEIVSNDWATVSTVPKDVSQLAKQRFSEEKENTKEFSETPPDIIVVTKPSELVVTNGDFDYKPIKDTALLYVNNTENDLLLDINSQSHYLLLNGRWYASQSMDDKDWSFVEPGDIPEEFAEIPADGSSIASVRVNVPGTPEAKEAEYDQYIPQTAAVDRDAADTKVTYDGEPKFEEIEGTDMAYAVNTQSSVLLIDNTFYVVDDGVWFQSDSANGPWTVSDKRPDSVEKIPPSSPVYNVKYVYIYDSTPDIVYVGYTPGYYHSYVYGGMVVYGTGYYYQPWYGYYYYPRPVTYGFGVHYNPYTGWGFSVGISYGWLTLSFSSHSYWGPGGYAHGYRHGYYHGYHHGYHNGYRAGYARGRYDARNAYQGRRSLDGRPVRDRPGIQTGTRRGSGEKLTNTRQTVRQNPTRPSNRKNNVFADRDGNVFERTRKGDWKTKVDTRTNRTGTQRTQTRPTIQNRQQLDRQFNNRSRGNSNFKSFNQNRSRTTTVRRVGGRRG